MSVLNLIVFLFSVGMLIHYLLEEIVGNASDHELISVIKLAGFFILSIVNIVCYATNNGMLGIDLFNGAVLIVMAITLGRKYGNKINLPQVVIIIVCGMLALANIMLNIAMTMASR